MAAPPPPPPPARGGLSLYANLLDPSAPDSAATISGAPVLYSSGDGSKDEAQAKKPLDPSLRFQPIRRPQVKSRKAAKPTFPKPTPAAPQNSAPAPSISPAPTTKPSDATGPPPGAAAAAAQQQQQRTTIADWAPTEQDEWNYGLGEKRQRGGRKKKKKKLEDQQLETDWDEIYDPSKPTNVDEYLRSDERIREVQDWKAVLYRHRRQRSPSDDSEDEAAGPQVAPSQFAPPVDYSFAPPPLSPPSVVAEADNASGDDVYARRLALSSTAPSPPPDLSSRDDLPPPPPPPTAEPPTDAASISRAPVRYSQPRDEEQRDDDEYSPPPTLGLGAAPASPTRNADQDDEAAPRSSRPGQAGFAHRLMSKYGWTKGSGLGVDESGIVNPLRVQVEKRKKKSDAEGGGWADPANKAKILGGKRKDGGASKFGPMSDVVVLRNMLEGMDDLRGEIASGLGQEIGEECGEKYGRVERLYIDVEDRQVFIKFTDQVSALRAVSELDGRIFNGNRLVPSFYDTEKFEQSIYR